MTPHRHEENMMTHSMAALIACQLGSRKPNVKFDN